MYGSIFFFKQKTAYEMRISDWSSDVCSSDLGISESPGGRSLLLWPSLDKGGSILRAAEMILYFSTKEHRYTVDELIVYWCRDLAGTVLSVDYGELFRMKSLPRATYIFSDLERLSTDEIGRALV